MMIASSANSTALPFFFISDMYSAGEVKTSITTNCTGVVVSDPIPFNSTGNIQLGSVVQYYRGETAAIVLRGYENAKEMPGSPGLAPNPPFPPSINVTEWACLNATIGGSIPLMNGSSHLAPWKIVLAVVLPVLFVSGCCYCICFPKKKQKEQGFECVPTKSPRLGS